MSPAYTDNQEGWTLVEVMIVVLLMGIIASVAIPIYRANVQRAKMSEADAALGTVRMALRVYYAERNSYPAHASYTRVDSIDAGISASDLNGKYFTISDFKYESADGTNYTIRATGGGSQTGINRQIDQNGGLSNF